MSIVRLHSPQRGFMAHDTARLTTDSGHMDCSTSGMRHSNRIPVLVALLAMACDPEVPDDTPDAGLHPSAESERGEHTARVSGFRDGEEYDPPASPGAELAKLDAELSEILDPLLAHLDEHGVTREQIEKAMGDIRAERVLLGLSLTEYHEIQRKIDGLLERARPLLAARPLTRDGRGGDGTICTTTTTVDEWDDGTIVITDRESCWPWFPDGGGSSGGNGKDGPGGGGGGSVPDFETACRIEGGKVENGRCQCARGSKCKGALWRVAVASGVCIAYFPSCLGTVLAWADFAWECNQRPCDAINRKHDR